VRRGIPQPGRRPPAPAHCAQHRPRQPEQMYGGRGYSEAGSKVLGARGQPPVWHPGRDGASLMFKY